MPQVALRYRLLHGFDADGFGDPQPFRRGRQRNARHDCQTDNWRLGPAHLHRDAEVLQSEEINTLRARLISRGWETALRDNEAGIEVFRFTGVVSPEDLSILQATDEADGG